MVAGSGGAGDIPTEDDMTAKASERRNGRSMGSLERTTGRDREAWFAVLDGWGATGRRYREIAGWLTGTHGLSAWWAQKLIVEYEQARGLRPPGVRPDGTFEIGASKTVGVSAERAMLAFTDPDVRERWLPGSGLREAESAPARMMRFELPQDGSRVHVELISKAPDRTLVSVRQVRLPDADRAAAAKARWRERLVVLRTLLES